MKKPPELSSTALHFLAAALMLCDHLWGTVVPGNDWLTCIGRLSFPIYAFLLVEGFHHTRSRKAYAKRLLVFALISELPFNLALGGNLFFPVHQNVLFTFLLSLGLMAWNEGVREAAAWKRLAVALGSMVLGAAAALLTMVDYYHAGVLTVLVFYFFRGSSWKHRLAQLAGLWWINTQLLGGFCYVLELFGREFLLQQQALAVLALIPIWLYRGAQGAKSKALRLGFYIFYPAHLLVLGLLGILL